MGSAGVSGGATSGITAGADDDDDDANDDGDGGTLGYDVGSADDGGGGPGEPASCEASEELEVVACEDKEPPDSFDAAFEWVWDGDGDFRGSTSSPLVANLTDDNEDGVIDLCDTPDVVVVVFDMTAVEEPASRIYVLDGATGAVHFSIDHPVASASTPALGDIDGDGNVEIVASEPWFLDGSEYKSYVVAFEHDGTLAWRSDSPVRSSEVDALAIADLDADGDAEIMMKAAVFDHEGRLQWSHPELSDSWDASTAADLDGDGQLEVIYGPTAYRADGTLYYAIPEFEGGFRESGFPQVADIDGDGAPEVTFNTGRGITIVEHDGTISTYREREDLVEGRPGIAADLDGDGAAELSVGHRTTLSLFDGAMTPAWTSTATDSTCCAGPAAFDFLGLGAPQLVFAGDDALSVFDADGGLLGEYTHGSGTGNETPVVVDVDNDGSAEIVFVSNGLDENFDPVPTLSVLGDADDRWLQARRIWNQHTYHVTNVREDGTIPQHEPRHWETLNTFRTQAAITNGMPCDPDPEG